MPVKKKTAFKGVPSVVKTPSLRYRRDAVPDFGQAVREYTVAEGTMNADERDSVDKRKSNKSRFPWVLNLILKKKKNTKLSNNLISNASETPPMDGPAWRWRKAKRIAEMVDRRGAFARPYVPKTPKEGFKELPFWHTEGRRRTKRRPAKKGAAKNRSNRRSRKARK